MHKEKAIVLVNVGTPDSPKVKDVRKYLFEFLNDKRVIDLPFLLRKFLVNLIIVPFRAPKSAKLYQQLWTDKGSPILYHSYTLKKKLQKVLNDEADVYIAMRYQSPSILKVFKQIAAKGYKKVQVVPLFPHYAESTTGTTIACAKKVAEKFKDFPPLNFVAQFYNHPAYIKAFVAQANAFDLDAYDHILFSYHGLPMRQIQKAHPNENCDKCTCTERMPAHGKKCYKATCYETTRLLSSALELNKDKCSTAFQSRLSNNWMEPFSDKIIKDLALKGAKKILVFAPAFVTDCLETILEIGDEYKELFKANGGEVLDLVPSLNDSEAWVQALRNLVAE